MAHVIAQPCINVKDTACIEVCPVDCIHSRPAEAGFAVVDQLFIDPEACIDCGHCVSACPVSAILLDSDLPPEWKEFITKNADYFKGVDR